MTYLFESTYDSITIKETTRKNYDAFKAAYDIYPFLESSWIESFKCDYIDPIYFEFLRTNNRVGIASGIIVKSKDSNLYTSASNTFSQNKISS